MLIHIIMYVYICAHVLVHKIIFTYEMEKIETNEVILTCFWRNKSV